MTTPTPVLFTLVACLYLVSPRYRIRLREHPRSFGLKDDKPAVLQCFLVLLEFSSALSTPPINWHIIIMLSCAYTSFKSPFHSLRCLLSAASIYFFQYRKLALIRIFFLVLRSIYVLSFLFWCSPDLGFTFGGLSWSFLIQPCFVVSLFDWTKSTIYIPRSYVDLRYSRISLGQSQSNSFVDAQWKYCTSPASL